MSALRSLFSATVLLGILGSGCIAASTEPQGGEPTTKTEQDLTLVSYVPPPAPLPFPPPNAQYCMGRPIVSPWQPPPPTCSVKLADEPERSKLLPWGCSPMQVESIVQPPSSRVVHVALCPDNASVRAEAAALHWGVTTAPCDTCVPHAPAGQVYVGYVMFIEPGCPGGCPRVPLTSDGP